MKGTNAIDEEVPLGKKKETAKDIDTNDDHHFPASNNESKMNGMKLAIPLR
jgi:hypothetical protein